MSDLRLRIPEDVKAWLMADAERNQRSMNGQMVWLLRREMAASAAATSEETGAHVGKQKAPATRVISENRK